MGGFAEIAKRVGILVALLILAGCAGDVARPDIVRELTPEQKPNLRVADVAGEARQGVVMTQPDIDRIIGRVKAEIAAFPGGSASAPPGDQTRPVKVKIVFTQYDEGSRFARFMLMGLGQIHIDADVDVVDGASGDVLGQYKVSKDFALGGLYGGVTSIEDVEKGFARSVAEIFKTKT